MNTLDHQVTVMTVTRGRPSLLIRAIDSVNQQDHPEVTHIVLIDDCAETYTALKNHKPLPGSVHYFLRARRTDEQSGPIHLARLRNLMIRMADTRWVCFLDDDNEYEPDHIAALIACACRHKVSAVHSWSQLFTFDGKPYLTRRWPWSRDEAQGQTKYQKMVAKGAVEPGSHILKEGVANFPDRCIDTSAWLLEKAILADNTMSDNFSFQEWVDNKAEDDKLMSYLLAREEAIVCNEKASLKYYLGGYSTNHQQEHQHSQVWQWQGG